MADTEGKYNIKAVAQILGIQPGTLRAWERRYQMIAPVRNSSGHRLYTEEHIKILKWLMTKINQGFTISQAISLMERSQSQIEAESIHINQVKQLPNLSDQLYDALIYFKTEKANDVINTMFSIFTIEKVILDIFYPLLRKIEEDYLTGRIIKAQSHFSCKLLKTRIAAIIQGLPFQTNPMKAITAFSPGEEDYADLLMFTFFLRKRGLEVIDIGDLQSEEEISRVIQIIQPELLMLSCDKEDNLSAAFTLIKQLVIKQEDLTVGLGGKAITALKEPQKHQFAPYLIGQTPNEWATWLLERMRL